MYFVQVRLAMNLGDIISTSNTRKDEASNQQQSDVKGLTSRKAPNNNQHVEIMVQDQNDLVNKKSNVGKTRTDQTIGKTHPLLEPPIVTTNDIAGTSKKRDCQKLQGISNKKIDDASKQHNDVQDHNDVMDEESDQGVTRICQNVGKNRSLLEDKSHTRSRVVIANNVAENSKKKGLISKSSFNNNLHTENMVQDHDVDMNEESDQDSESESHDDVKKTRGPTFLKEIWGRPSSLPPIKIHCDDMGRPIGSRRNKFIDFLGSLARNGKFCPIDVENWKKMSLDKRQKMLDIIKEKYDLPPGTENWTLCSIAKKWRNWKSELKKKYYDPELPIQVLLQHRDERVLVEQYVKLIVYWNSEKSKERSEKNKVARKQKIMNQTTGRKSFAQVQQKLRKEKGRPPSRVELFHACFTHANGSPSGSIVAEKLSAMKELENQLPGDWNDQVGREDIFAQIIGPDRPGRVRMLGDGVSPSDLWGEVPSRSTCNRIVMEQKAKLEKMEEKVRKQGQHITMLEEKISNQPNQNLGSNCTSSSNNPILSVPAYLSLKIGCSVSIKSLFDSTKIVAKGVIRCMDPNTEVGRQILGPNWCEIQVLVVIEPEESLIRPYDLLQRFGDALGGMIAWPYHLLTANEDFY